MTKKKLVNTSAVSQVDQTPNSKVGSTANNESKLHENQKPAVKQKTQISESINKTKNSINKQSSAIRRNPAIDGLRALAIIAIVCFHMRPSLLPGGFLGVTLFLVLAGYFCTRSVLRYLTKRESAKNNKNNANKTGNENHENNAISAINISNLEVNPKIAKNYLQYVWHRIKRIWPSTIGIIAITAPVMWLFSPSLLPKLQLDAASGAGFFSNITYVARKLSYFEQSGLPSPIKHLWYLGLIMQAFVVWPLILATLVRFVRKKIVCLYIIAGLAIASSALIFAFANLFGNYSTPARVYYSLDTRASEFLIGAMLAMYSAWFSKHSLHAWLIHVWYWLRGNKNLIVQLASTTKNNLDNTENNAEKFENSANSKSELENSIPEDLRAGLQIDFEENKEISVQELPENAFSKPKTVFYNPLHAWQRSCIGLLATAVLCYCFVNADGTSSVFTFGGYTLAATTCMLIVWSCTQTDNICSRLFSFQPLSYLGKRSFSIYLVHFPILELCNPATRTRSILWWEQLLQVVIIVVIAECFYQLFENPIKENGLLKLTRYCAVTLCSIIVVALIALPANWQDIAKDRAIQLRPELATSATQQKKPSAELAKTHKSSSAKKAKSKEFIKNVVKNSLPPTPSKHRVLFPIAEKVPQNFAASHTQINERNNTCSVNLTMVGDSITEGAKPYLMKVLPNAYIDGKVSRQIFHGADEYEQDIANKHAGDVIIYALGTNGPPNNDSVLQQMVDAAKGKPVYFVTTRVPQPWQDITNERLRKFAATHPKVGIINWHGVSESHSEYLTDDGVHLTPVGGPEYAKMIRLALCGA